MQDWFDARLLGRDEALEPTLTASDAAGLPPIAVSASQGALLQSLAAAIAARRILEVGTLGGYCTIWLARALPAGGRLIGTGAPVAGWRRSTVDIRRSEDVRANS